MNNSNTKITPVINSDFPDPDIIRVDDTYYMVSTTMYYMPGCDILRSFNLTNWEFVGHAYDTLYENDAYEMKNGEQVFGQGMWAPSFRYHNGTFYIVFASNDLHKTFLLTARNPSGPWKKGTIEGFYYDSSLFFDEDERVFIVHGQGTIQLTELDNDLKGPKPNGLQRILIQDEEGIPLGYEGSHLYRRNGKYYLFNCHFNGKDKEIKTQDYYMADSLEGEFKGGCLINDDFGYRGLGVAQGGIVDTPWGDWYAFMFQDRGAIGRAPVLLSLQFEDDKPVVSRMNGKEVKSTRPDYSYEPLNGDDDFLYSKNDYGIIPFKNFWQFSHNPHWDCLSVSERKGALRYHSEKVSKNLIMSQNTLTQRCYGFSSSASILIDGAGMKNGDYAGICTYLNCYGAIALTRQADLFYLVLLRNPARDESFFGQANYTDCGEECARIQIQGSVAMLRAETEFTPTTDLGRFYYRKSGKWKQLGSDLNLYFKMDFFTGCRFGLFYFSTEETGGLVDFMKFRYRQ